MKAWIVSTPDFDTTAIDEYWTTGYVFDDRAPHHRLTNGILLRSDLHTLFDLNLIGIHPAQLRIRIHPSLKGTEYEQFAGARLNKGDGKGPSRRALELRWRDFGSCTRPTKPVRLSPETTDRIEYADTRRPEAGAAPPP